MQMCLKIALYVTKLTDKLKMGMKNTKFNWPEISRYCGLCKLSTGIYIKSFVTLIATSALVSINFKTVNTLKEVHWDIKYKDPDIIDDYLVDTSYDRDSLALLVRSIILYFVMWTAFKCFYILMISLLIVSIYTKRTSLLKYVLYVIIPTSIFDLFLSIVGASIAKFWTQILALSTFFLEAYNLVAVSSEYKRLVGKSRIVNSELESRFETRENPVISRQPSNIQNSNARCPRCTCLLEESSNDIEGQQSSTNSTQPSIAQDNTQVKELNFKDENIIFDQSQLVERSESVVSEAYSQSGSNSSSISDIPPEKLKKKDIADVPIIYDQSQLNVGMSPVVEDRTFILPS